ncbi:hypothetical protein [Sorangium cellulosum]|uniref:TolA protein n=1 Tax=Sorangium cellulosum So0157-2 TaxID=1254432 RepID=S4YBX2_SORCE|nr:hypothetical protein [Sorangium cellulosum]AGP41851.1 hypothetical protein SCE1572_49595 [Sorangium cellulosum So0157-2]
MASRTKGTRGGAPPPGGVVDEEEEVDALYKKPLADFTRARDELAKRLRQAGDKGASDRVKALRRPTAAAWTLNQLARRYPQRMEALLDAGERLREAQRGALGPGGAQGLKDAGQKHRAVVNELLRAAPALFAEGGYREKGNPMDRLRDSLLATPTASPSDLELLARGRLSGELEPGDLSDMLGLLRGRPSERPAEAGAGRRSKGAKAETPARRRGRAEKEAPERQKRAGEEREKQRAAKEREQKARRAADEREKKAKLAAERRERKERLAAEQRQQKAQLAAAEKERDQASREASRAAKEADRLTKEAARMSRAAEKAEEAARAARKRADEAERSAAEAQQKAAEGASRLEAAEDRLDRLGR